MPKVAYNLVKENVTATLDVEEDDKNVLDSLILKINQWVRDFHEPKLIHLHVMVH